MPARRPSCRVCSASSTTRKRRCTDATPSSVVRWVLTLLVGIVLAVDSSDALLSTPRLYHTHHALHGSTRCATICNSNINNISDSRIARRTDHDRCEGTALFLLGRNNRIQSYRYPSPLYMSNSGEDERIDDDPRTNSDNDVSKEQDPRQQSKTDGKPKDSSTNKRNDKANLLEMINPYKAGKSFRSTLSSAINLASAIASTSSSPASRLPPERRAIYYNYYLDDQLGLSSAELKDETTTKYGADMTTSSPWISSSSSKDYRPEVLVVGATGALGRVLVKRLILENKVRVRVLVRDLYSSTLNKLGTGVTYCQGDLNNMESLEYAVTDVDKIVFCAGGKRIGDGGEMLSGGGEWDRLESILDQRSQQAELVDGKGLRNLIHAYLNVRHADYGTSQAAKRVLFKFGKRPADFDLFGIDDGSVDGGTKTEENDYYKDFDEDDDYGEEDIQSRPRPYSVAAALSQCDWKKNKFGNAVFVGKIGRYGEAAIVSARLRSRNDPDQGIDLRSGGFAGLVCRVCSNGGVYEAFVRTEAYERLGVEYVCEFRTSSKSPKNSGGNASRDKFATVRLEFSDFRPRMRQGGGTHDKDAQRMRRTLGQSDIPPFIGRDVRQLGFRYRGQNNAFSWSESSNSGWSSFYLALDYIKVYRGQSEPEFVYLSDANIPPVVQDGMVRDDIRRLATSSLESDSYSIIDEENNKLYGKEQMDRIAEETYFKYRGEEIIKQSGLR